MRTRIVACGLTLVVAACASRATVPPRPAESCAGAPARDVADVRPVLERRCFGCHSGDGVAAEDHDFSRPETLRAQRSSIAEDVAGHVMPPASSPQLSGDEATLLLQWARCGGGSG